MIVKFKRLHPDAVEPAYAKPDDAAMDLTAVDSGTLSSDQRYISYDTGLAFEIPPGFVGLLFSRSSISNYDLTLSCGVGVLDAGYRHSVSFRFKSDTLVDCGGRYYEKGDRIGQIMIIERPSISFVEVDELAPSERGTSGFGSSGR